MKPAKMCPRRVLHKIGLKSCKDPAYLATQIFGWWCGDQYEFDAGRHVLEGREATTQNFCGAVLEHCPAGW